MCDNTCLHQGNIWVELNMGEEWMRMASFNLGANNYVNLQDSAQA
jgi:hypothetical protein